MYLSATVFTLNEPVTAKEHLLGSTRLWHPHSRGTPKPRGTKFCHKKTTDLAAAHGEDFVILACTVLKQITSVTDIRTDRQTPRRWLRRVKHSAIARKKRINLIDQSFSQLTTQQLIIILIHRLNINHNKLSNNNYYNNNNYFYHPHM